MRIAYCTNVRLPSERAHGHQIAQVCDALDALGYEVTVFAPRRRNPVARDYHAYYGARRGVHIEYLGSFDPINRAWLPGVLGLWMLNALLRAAYRRKLRASGFDLLYTRAPALLPALLATGIPTVIELHALPRIGRRRFVRSLARCQLIVCLTSIIKRELEREGIDPARMIVEGDAYDPALFAYAPAQREARALFDLQPDVPVIGYVGQLTSMGLSKGIPELLGAVTLLHQRGVPFTAVIAGGPEDARRRFEETLEPTVRRHVRFLGFIDHTRVPALLAACDVLAYPAPASDHPYYNRDTSPLKLFEYMAAGRPIACADLPPLRDVVDESSVRFCAPGDAASLADAIGALLADESIATAIAHRAREVAQRHTWLERMRRVMDGVTLRA